MTLYAVGLAFAGMAALGYTLASFFLKASMLRGATSGQVNLTANIALGLVVQPLWFFASADIANPPLWLPAITCFTFFLGQVFTFAALSSGDVSVATPVLGTKVILVTFFNAILFATPVSARWWIASIAASVAVATIAVGTPHGERGAAFRTGALALISAGCFSFTDVLVQRWAGTYDPMVFLPAMFGGVSVLSTLWYAAMDRRAFHPPSRARAALGIGSAFLGVQCALMFLSLAWTRDATAANVVYSLRSLLSVVLAGSIGAAFGLRESALPLPILVLRGVGASLLFGAIALILWK
jgi:drug/metabolite transporter (DMT)-like permease